MLEQFAKFASAGAIGTALHYLILATLVSFLFFSPVVASTLGALAGAGMNYWLNRNYTFRSTRRHREALPRFIMLAGLGLTLNAFIVGLTTTAGLHYLVAQVVATCGVLIINFLVSRIWIFRQTRL